MYHFNWKQEQMKETFIIVGSNYGIATFIDLKSKTVKHFTSLLI